MGFSLLSREILESIGRFARIKLISILLLIFAATSGAAQESVTGVQPIPGFDHARDAGFPLTGRHAQVICESCHIDNRLAGTPRDCVSCHNGARAPGKPANHPPASNTCSECHTTQNFVPFAFDHTRINQDCQTCHNGARARGKPANHIAAADSCDDCHVTTGFTDVRVEHSSVIGTCSDCHNGGVAPGQPSNHIPADGQECAACHSTFFFAAAVMDHSSVSAMPCAACHNNQVVLGKPTDHIPAPETCGDCHSPFFEESFTSVNLDHDVVPGDCASCHFPGNNFGAPYKPVNHPPNVSEDCASCHNTFAFAVGQAFNHAEIGASTGCYDCHYPGNPFDAVTRPHTDTTDNCEECHTSTASFSIAMMDHSEASSVCSNCHIGGQIGATQQPVWHTASVGECSDCHVSTLSFGSVIMDHTGDNDDCSACHIANAANWGATSPPTWHFDPSMSGISCTSCHSSGAMPQLSSLNHTVVGFDTSDCSSCHALGSTPTPPAFHAAAGVTSNDCTFCHASAAVPTPAMQHSGFVNSECAECHFTYQSSTLDPNNPGSGRQTHVSTDNCVGCHAQPF